MPFGMTVICLECASPRTSSHLRDCVGQTQTEKRVCPHTVLLRIGFTFARCCHGAGELLPRLSILTACARCALCGGLFLLHFPGSRLRRTLSVILPCGARTFLMPIPFGAMARDGPTCFGDIIYRMRKKVKRTKILVLLPLS